MVQQILANNIKPITLKLQVGNVLKQLKVDLEKSGNCCVANKDTGEKCYNTRLPNSLYCNEHITNKPYGLPE